MTKDIAALIERITALEAEVEAIIEARRDALRVRIAGGKPHFEPEPLRRHRLSRIHWWRYVRSARPLVLLTAPVIYALIVPLVALDLFFTVYQAVCFPVYGIGRARRGDYLVIDRAKLGYLNGIEKFNCLYCSYANGLIAYVQEIAGRTELYWCPIKHSQRLKATHGHYDQFVDYGDAENYQRELAALRAALVAQRAAET